MQLSPGLESKLSAYGALLLRVGLATVMIAHALLKLCVFTLGGTAQFFAAHGFPGWTAYPVFAFELLGGVLLLVGIGVRVVALVLIPVMMGALLVHLPNGWMFTAPNGGWEYVAFLIVALAVQALVGGGAGVWKIRSTNVQGGHRHAANGGQAGLKTKSAGESLTHPADGEEI